MKCKKLLSSQTLTFALLLIFIKSSFSQSPVPGADLFRLLDSARIEQVMELINKDPALLEARSPRGSTPLIIAAADGHTDLVKFLIKKGANVNAANNYGNTPLHYAAWKGDLESFRTLSEKGANMAAKNSRGQNCLQYACMGGNMDIFRYCVDKGMDIMEKSDDGSKLIHWAANGGNIELFKHLESKGLEYNALDNDGISPVFWAASSNKLDIVKYLVEEKGVDVNSKTKDGSCLLMTPINYGFYDVTKYLLDKGADINQQLNDHSTWLIMAAESGSPELVKLLIEKGSDINAFDDYGNNPLIMASAFGRLDIVKLLVENGAKTEPGICKRESCTNSGRTPLMAAASRNPSIAKYLISKGADVNKTDLEGNTALHNATWGDSLETIDILVKNKCNINAKNKLGETALIRTVQRKKPGMLKKMIEYKADVNLTDNSGKTALHYAAIYGFGEIFTILTENGANSSAKDAEGHMPEYYAAYYGNDEIKKVLMTKGTANEKAPENTGLLKKELKEKEAVVWYLNHSGWAIKTKNHLLVIDYWDNNVNPDKLCLNNGFINPEEIAGLKVTAIASHNHQDHFDQRIFGWTKTIGNINYVLGFNNSQNANCTYIAPHEEKNIDGVKITAIASTDSGEGFMIEVDGLVIYHPGDHANRFQDEDKDFTSEIDFLAEKYKKIDIAFVPISGCNFRDKTVLKKGNDYLVSRFSPTMVLPMHGSGSEFKYREYSDERNKLYNTNIYRFVSFRGDRLVFEEK
ncbi:MAG: hypothetical protein A2W91_19825 [Bacteroidetes bacterium GWF2_38_335]|nr:MAG: hypothetical protein A2W91_19825 [Bacteroidetes bacterium GWF2_38_335]OFY79261.1 MAG: hypothetical protein A2281_15830 [Bacteroidetes bacterium RIFOXYA12_FULL_38_20]HBS86467.1 hypothetical protein [Bacteroidales bacterium]